jgi:hypothetical protein
VLPNYITNLGVFPLLTIPIFLKSSKIIYWFSYFILILIFSSFYSTIVLNPKEGIYLNEPIVVFDYGSLYPSSMISRNLSHDTYINDKKYIYILTDYCKLILESLTNINNFFDIYQDESKIINYIKNNSNNIKKFLKFFCEKSVNTSNIKNVIIYNNLFVLNNKVKDLIQNHVKKIYDEFNTNIQILPDITLNEE